MSEIIENLIKDTEKFQLENEVLFNFDDFNCVSLRMHRQYGHSTAIRKFIKNNIEKSKKNKKAKDKIVVVVANHAMKINFIGSLQKELQQASFDNVSVITSNESATRLRGIDCKYVFVDTASYIGENKIKEIKNTIHPIASCRKSAGKTFVCCFLG